MTLATIQQREAQVLFQMLDLLAERGCAVLSRSAARVKLSSSATAMK
jgi:hypothetical protein